MKGLLALLIRIFGAPPERVSAVALEWAHNREVLPTSLGSAAAREQIDLELRSRSVWSAKTTNAEYLQGIRDAVDRILIGGRDNDLPQLRLELKQLLQRLEYSPATGFPGDEDLGIEPADPGSLQDLSSDRRINFVLETQLRLARGASLRARGLEAGRLSRYPAWELVRVMSRRMPRGSAESNSEGWGGRWLRAGGPIVPGGKLIALKTDPIWAALGDSELFEDALDVEHPPFAFGSGMGWREVSRSEAEELGLLSGELGRSPAAAATRDVAPASPIPPAPVTSTRGLDPDLRTELLRQIKAKRAEKPDHVRYAETLQREVAAADADYLKRNPDLVGMN